MTDRTPPPDLLDDLDDAIRQAEYGSYYRTIDTREAAFNTLAALAEWADGALIDPGTWTRWDREEVGSGWYRNRLTGELSPWGDEPCPPENRVYTLTERGDQ